MDGRHVALDGGIGGDHAVEHAIERTASHDATVLAFERPGCGIARIGKWGLIRGHLCSIQRFKPGPWEENLPPNLEISWRRTTQFQGDAPDGSDIRRDVFSDGSVTARQCPLKLAVLVLQRDGHAIVFQLHDKFHLLAFQDFIRSFRPIGDVLGIV